MINNSKKQYHLRDWGTAIAFSLLVWIVLFQGLYQVYKTDNQTYLDELISKQEIAWQAATKMFQRGVEARFQSEIYQPEVLELLVKAQNPRLEQQARIDLYRLLYPYYQKRLRQNDGHFQLHFHTADNHSFLRFHQPEKFGDDLSQARPTVVKANQTLRPVYAYESGKIISGLRHVFPIVYKGRHLGSVELSQKFESLRKEIALFNPQHEFTILYNRKLLEAKSFKQFSYIYSPSPISSEWLEEDAFRILPQTPLPLSQTMHDISEIAKNDPSLNADLDHGEEFAKVYPFGKTYYALTFTPIHDINQQNMAYLISLSQADEITVNHQRLWTYGTILTLIVILFAYGLWRILASRRQQYQYQTYLEGINNTIGEGLYVTDTDGLISTANESAQKILGYSEEELLGLNPHDLFHKALDTATGAHHCPIEEAANNGETFQGELVFIRKNRHEMLASVSSQPLIINNRLKGSVVSFKDITDQKAIDEALHIAATAFETQEGIMITDPKGNILRANKAFSKLTGFSQDEVIGKTPRILNSGVQDKEFYRQMWQNLLKNHFWQGEIWNRRKNGDIYLEWLTITAVVDKTGKITQFVANFSDVTERHKAQEEIQRLAFYDPLTKLPNRRLLLDRLEQAILHSQRTHQCGALFFIDLDNFKTLNDSKGHMVGDLLLKEVANRLSSAVRDVDTVSRIGGDEFVILMENLGENSEQAATHAEEVALKILDIFRNPFTVGHQSHHTSPSIGVEIIHCRHNHSDEILMHADLAMYQAKKHGRNTVRFFDPQMQTNVEQLASLQADLRAAIDQKQFELYYQPQVNQHAEIIYAEGLIRWNHPEKGFISPAQFIPLAEDSGLIVPIGDWVLKTACEALVKWRNDPELNHIKLAVNVSAKQFAENDFVEKVKKTLEETGANPNYLKLELTESVVVKDIEKTILTMNALRDIGVRFSMDDFGTGHSSLSNLKRLPLSQLKIDQSFIRDLTVDNDDAIIVKTIIAMSNTLKLEVIAEGVETYDQKDFLNQNQCYVYQGYLFSRPIAQPEFESLVKSTSQINALVLDDFEF